MHGMWTLVWLMLLARPVITHQTRRSYVTTQGEVADDKSHKPNNRKGKLNPENVAKICKHTRKPTFRLPDPPSLPRETEDAMMVRRSASGLMMRMLNEASRRPCEWSDRGPKGLGLPKSLGVRLHSFLFVVVVPL